MPKPLHADTLKRTLNGNMTERYVLLPPEADSIAQIFTRGEFYGRIRIHGFGYVWGDELVSNGKVVRKDHAIVGVGGSFIYKTASFRGFSATAGLYSTTGIGTLSPEEAYLYKGGKDTFNRYNYVRYGKKTLTTLAQAYLEYRHAYVDVKAGRQIFESFLTASNDTKMIPNTFSGYSAEVKTGRSGTLKFGYLTRQKLRDHDTFHHLLAYGYDGNDPLSAWTQNDDSAMHRGLTLQKLRERGIKDRMYVAELKSKPLRDMSVWLNYTALPDLLSYAMVQAGYSWHVSGLDVTPAVRYMRQFDDGAGEIGGANLKTVTEGYRDPDSLEGWLVGARIDVKSAIWRLRAAYTKIGDKGDIVAPWRGFPTGGFTRVMGQYNWNADTETYVLQYDYDLDKAGAVSGLKAMVRVAVQDFDDTKPGVQADSNVFELGLREDFASIPGALVRLRWAHIVGDDDTVTPSGVHKLDPSADVVRLEFDYLF